MRKLRAAGDEEEEEEEEASPSAYVCARKRAAENEGKRARKTHQRSLIHSFIREGARARHDTNAPLLVDIPRHDAHFALLRLDNTRAVRTNHPVVVL